MGSCVLEVGQMIGSRRKDKGATDSTNGDVSNRVQGLRLEGDVDIPEYGWGTYGRRDGSGNQGLYLQWGTVGQQGGGGRRAGERG